MASDAPHTFRWFQTTSRNGGAWGTIWTNRRRPVHHRWTDEHLPRVVRLHMRRSIIIAGKQFDYDVAHNLSRREAWRIGWALVVRSLTR